MSVSVNITGLMSQDDPEYKKHLEVVEFCHEKKVSVPKETVEYFRAALDGDDINDYSLKSKIEELENGLPVSIEYEGDVMYGDGAFIDMKKIPAGVTRVRIYCDV